MKHEHISEKRYSNTGNIEVLKLIPSSANAVLDVGCGEGNLAVVIQKSGIQIDGVTYSQEEANIAKAHYRNIWVFNLENGLPPLSEKYDVVVCSHVLEHICYSENLMQGIRNCLEPNGIVIVALPNIMHYSSRFQLMLGNFNYQKSGVWDYTHFRWYTFKTGRKLLEESGFKIITSRVTGDIPLLTFFWWVPLKIRKIIFKILTSISKGFFGGQLIYVAKAE